MVTKLDSVLLVGGSGFLGLHLIEQFYRNSPKTKIFVFDVRPLSENLSAYFTFPKENVEVIQGDLTSEDDVKNAIERSKCDVIVHSASPLHGLPREVYEKVNIHGTENLIKVAKKSSVKALVYTSSAGVIFNGNDVYNANESWPYPDVHMDGYNETKAIAESMVLKTNDPEGLLTICIRPAGIFGPGDRQLIPGLTNAAKSGQSKFQLGDNKNLFDWTYVGNVADAHVLAAQKILDPKYAGQLGGETFFVSNDNPTYFWTLARSVWKAYGHIDNYNIVLKKPIALTVAYISAFVGKLTNREPNLTPFRVKVVCATRYHDITKAKQLLGYKPAVDLESGIQYTLEWLEEFGLN